MMERNDFGMFKEVESNPVPTTRLVRAAFQRTAPVLFGYVPIGIAFGFLFTQSGYAPFYAVAMSILIYSGATQFLAVGFLLNNAPLIEIALTTLLLNLRHSFFGLSLIGKFSSIPRVKPYLIFALTDETYALLTASPEPPAHCKERFYLFVSLFNHLYWITGTFIGAILGHVMRTGLRGMDFALTALFVVLVVDQYRKIRSFKPFLVGAAVGIGSLAFLPPDYMLLTSILAGTAMLLSIRGVR